MRAGDAGLSLSYALNVTLTLQWLIRSITDFETNLTSIERIKEYCDLPPEVINANIINVS